MRRRSQPSHSPDHPRSRGVYFDVDDESPATSGSSPLARGLLRNPVLIVEGRRIIPARAGFTTVDPKDVPAEKDHPRSRGVYLRISGVVLENEGSSPLARGLLIISGI